MASTYLKRDITSNGNKKLFTFSMWVKRGTLGSEQRLLMGYDAGSGEDFFQFNSNDKMKIASANGVSYLLDLDSSRVFRDTSAWYHLVFAYDSTQATDTNRVKLYVNGEQETLTGTFPAPNNDILFWNTSGDDIDIGGRSKLNNLYFDGSLAHVHFVDGTAYDADTFGETDATTGIWKPKTAPSVTYGTNGFFLKFENSGAFGTDSSGNANTFTVNGTMTQTIDTPSNVFATLNPLKLPSGFSLSNGNTKFSTASASDRGNVNSTLLVNKGKYYAECKIVGGNEKEGIGAIGEDELPANDFLTGTQNILFNTDVPAVFINGSQTNVTGVTPVNNDIIGMALDLDNGRAYFHVNGTYINSGNPDTETGYYSFTVGSTYWGIGSADGSTLTGSAIMNYGNGYFGTTAVSSAQNPDDGIGIFEYDVPTGYRALCTKSINAEEYD
jgi:hypothetical protein